MSNATGRFLLTNDDGIDAPGLAALERAVSPISSDYVVVAPVGAQSGCSHQVTTHRGIVVEPRASDRTAVHGSPADCVRLGLHRLAAESTWILSGVNAGGNLGTDIHYSGTVAAVREGVIRGVPGIALSHYIARGRTIDWEAAARWSEPIIRRLIATRWIPGTFWNVNLPHPASTDVAPEVVFCPVDPSPLPLDFRHEPDGAVYSGDYQRRPRTPGGDVDVCFGGRIAVSLVVVTSSLAGPDPFEIRSGALATGRGPTP